MALTFPDKGEGVSGDFQSILFQEYWDVMMAGLAGTECVLSGCGVTANNNMAPSVAKGAVLSQGVMKAVTAGTVTIGTANATNPRIDLIVVDSSGAKQVRAGTAAAAPKPPARTAGDVLIAMVFVAANDTSIGSTEIVDGRVMRTQGPITIAKQTTAVVFNTTSIIQTYFSFTLPNGLFLAGKTLHVRCGGNMLINSGTPTVTLTINYGGTTLFADVMPTGAVDTDRRPWYLDFTVQAQANNDQAMNGLFLGTTTAVTAPTTGLGDVGTDEIGATAPIGGSSAVDSDANDCLVEVRFTMSVSNAADEIVLEYGTAILE
jgi:hypothetical protein